MIWNHSVVTKTSCLFAKINKWKEPKKKQKKKEELPLAENVYVEYDFEMSKALRALHVKDVYIIVQNKYYVLRGL